jgi:hypothetical protein
MDHAPAARGSHVRDGSFYRLGDRTQKIPGPGTGVPHRKSGKANQFDVARMVLVASYSQ